MSSYSLVSLKTITEHIDSENNSTTKGLDLCERFYHQIIKPIIEDINLDDNFQENHSAALIGYGSEVLGFDTEMSRDHDFAPRVILFLRDEKYHDEFGLKIKQSLDEKVPSHFEGLPCRLSFQIDPHSRNPSEDNKGDLLVKITTCEEYFSGYLLKRVHDGANSGVSYSEWLETRLNGDYSYWLSIPQQKLLATGQAGRIYHDCGVLAPIRSILEGYYPDIVWIYQIMIQLSKISQEAPFVGRCGIVGDKLGCHIQIGKIVREIMCLCFLLERKYYPYSKWFGTAFNKLKVSQYLSHFLEQVIQPTTPNVDQDVWWKSLELNLEKSYEIIVQLLNEYLVGYLIRNSTLPSEYLTPFKQDEIVCQFFGRPFVSFDHMGLLNSKLRTWIQYFSNDNNKATRNFANLIQHEPILKGSIDQTISQVEILETNTCYQDYHDFLSME